MRRHCSLVPDVIVWLTAPQPGGLAQMELQGVTPHPRPSTGSRGVRMGPQSGHARIWASFPQGLSQQQRAGPGWRGQNPTLDVLQRRGGRVFWVAFKGALTCPGSLACTCVDPGVGEACPLRGGFQVSPARGTLTPTAVGSAAHLLSQGVLAEQAGHRREPTDPLAAWPKVTETTHESQKFVQTHPPPSLGQEGSRPGRRVLRAVRADGCYRVSMKARGRARGPGGCLRGS